MNKFPKSERLHGQKQIEELFSKGTSFTIPPLRIVYLKKLQDSSVPNQVLVSASKKNFKRAVDRNQLKRRMREAYRLNKHVLEDSLKEFYLVIGYIYVGKEIASYQEIEEKLKQSLLRLRDIIGS